MSYLRDTVIILKNEPFREHDSWVTMYGKNHGKLVAVARGARRPQAKSLGHLEPLSEVDVMIAKGSAFDKLAVAHVVRPRLSLRQELGMLTFASSFADLIESLTKPALEDQEIFELFLEVLSIAERESATCSVARHQCLFAGATLKVLDLLGYAPAFESLAVSDSSRRLLSFMRREPLSAILSVTAPSQIFFEASLAIEGCVKRAALTKEPHGVRTLAMLLA